VASAHVKIIGKEGTGSGVHIGHGYILTAGHVGSMFGDLTAKDSAGRSHKVAVLWVNAKYDIALLRVDDAPTLATAPLSCAPVTVGQHVRSFGNPLDVENVFAEGVVAGAPRAYTAWASVLPVNVVVVPGMSGGALLDDSGQVVGINVGVMVTPYGMAGFGWIVPSSSVCELMGKA
jgi:serine protease Do